MRYNVSGNKSSEYFSIDSASGIIKTKKSFNDIDNDDLPFRLTVKTRDNPNGTAEFNEIQTPLIVNLVYETNRMILVIGDAKPDVVATKLDTVTHVVQDQTGLIVGVEKLSAREFIGANGTLETDPSATDVWFYVVDPETDSILPVNHTIVQR